MAVRLVPSNVQFDSSRSRSFSFDTAGDGRWSHSVLEVLAVDVVSGFCASAVLSHGSIPGELRQPPISSAGGSSVSSHSSHAGTRRTGSRRRADTFSRLVRFCLDFRSLPDMSRRSSAWGRSGRTVHPHQTRNMPGGRSARSGEHEHGGSTATGTLRAASTRPALSPLTTGVHRPRGGRPGNMATSPPAKADRRDGVQLLSSAQQ